MKKFLLLSLVAAPAMFFAQTSIISDNFDTYTDGNTLAAESGGIWETWSGTTPEDAFISSAQSSSPSNSVNVYNNGAGAYLHDVVMPFPSVYTSGTYEFKMKMYVPAGNGGYFNLGSVWTSGGAGYEYGIDIFLNADGSGCVSSPSVGVFSYTQDAWTDVSVMVNLTSGMADVSINGSQVYSQAWGAASGLGVVDVFGVAYSDETLGTEVTSNFYIDDVELLDWTGVGVEENNFENEMTVMPNPNNGEFNINFGDVASGMYDLNITDVLGNVVYTENLSITNGTSFNFDLDLANGIYLINVNNSTSSATRKIIVR